MQARKLERYGTLALQASALHVFGIRLTNFSRDSNKQERNFSCEVRTGDLFAFKIDQQLSSCLDFVERLIFMFLHVAEKGGQNQNFLQDILPLLLYLANVLS